MNIQKCLLVCALLNLSYAKPLKVFVCAGQSNMKGVCAEVSELPEEIRKQPENVVFNPKRNGPAWLPLEAANVQKAGFGPELSFAQEMSEHLGEPVGIIKHAVGGTELATRWDPDGDKSLYQVLFSYVQKAKESREIEIVGMIWMQGEADSKNEEYAAAYEQNLKDFVARARKDFDVEAMPYIAGRVNPPKGAKYVNPARVRAAQENAEISHYAYINCDELTKVADGVHYDAAGTVEMGRLFAKKMVALLAERADK